MVGPPAVLLDRIRTRLGQLYEEWLSRLALCHFATRDSALIEEQDALVAKLRRYQPDSYNGHLVAALAAFVLRRDLVAARREIAACNGSMDAAWRYSEAFLYAYEGDLQNAYRS